MKNSDSLFPDKIEILINKTAEKYKTLIENSNHAYFLTKPEGNILETNPVAITMFGYSKNEFLTLNKQQLFKHTEETLILDLDQNEEYRYISVEAIGIKKNGNHFPIEMASVIFYEPDGNIRTSILVYDLSNKNLKENGQVNFRSAIESISEGFLIIDNNWIITYLNEEAEKIFGISKNKISGNNILSMINNSEGIKFQSECLNAKQENRSVQFEMYFSPSGKWIHIKAYPSVNGLTVFCKNVSEQKEIINEIKESEQRYKMFVQHSTEGIWRIELDEAKHINTSTEELIDYCMTNGFLAECNDAFAKMYGYENASMIIGIPLNKLMPVENPVNYAYLHKFFTNNFKVENELSYELDKDGNSLIFINNMIGIVENNFIKRAWGTQRNITEQKKAEESLLISEEKYRYLFNNNPSCIFIWDMETLRFIEVNQTSIETYGYSRNDFLQLTALDIRPKEDWTLFLDVIDAARKNEFYKTTFTWKHINKKGEKVFMEILSQNILYNGMRAVLSIGNNITEKIQLENSLNEERQMRQMQITEAVIQGQERERSEIGEELHDNINQILASTRLYIECALTDDNIRKDLLDKGIFLLDSAMKEIRTLSRSLLPPSLGGISLQETINDLIEDIKLVNPVNFQINWINFNESALNEKIKITIFRIIQEQLNNITKHSKAKNAMIHLEMTDNQIILITEDDGIGFDTMTKRTGVGLRNISSRVEVNKGCINIESSPGAGCKLSVQLLITE